MKQLIICVEMNKPWVEEPKQQVELSSTGQNTLESSPCRVLQ